MGLAIAPGIGEAIESGIDDDGCAPATPVASKIQTAASGRACLSMKTSSFVIVTRMVRNRMRPDDGAGSATPARVHLVTGILERAGALLLVASRYPNHPAPLWNLPGGRQRHGELLHAALRREFLEETSLEIAVGELRYVAESYDGTSATHFTNFAFAVQSAGDPRPPVGDAHAVDVAWVELAALPARLSVAVVREPLVANLRNRERRYFSFADAGITIVFADAP